MTDLQQLLCVSIGAVIFVGMAFLLEIHNPPEVVREDFRNAIQRIKNLFRKGGDRE